MAMIEAAGQEDHPPAPQAYRWGPALLRFELANVCLVKTPLSHHAQALTVPFKLRQHLGIEDLAGQVLDPGWPHRPSGITYSSACGGV